MTEKKIFIVIAAWNEEKVIGKVLQGIKNGGYHNIVLVDDGSKDNTARVAGKEGVAVLVHKKNKGQGAALRTGINYAVRQGADVIVTFDADGQHKVNEIKNLAKPVLNGQVDIALGSRFLKKKRKLSFTMCVVLKIGVLLHLILYGVLLTDAHNGFRALSRKAAKKIRIKQNRMEHASEIIDQIKKQKLSFVEIPVTIPYTKYSVEKGQTTFDKIKVGCRIVWAKFFG